MTVRKNVKCRPAIGGGAERKRVMSELILPQKRPTAVGEEWKDHVYGGEVHGGRFMSTKQYLLTRPSGNLPPEWSATRERIRQYACEFGIIASDDDTDLEVIRKIELGELPPEGREELRAQRAEIKRLSRDRSLLASRSKLLSGQRGRVRRGGAECAIANTSINKAARTPHGGQIRRWNRQRRRFRFRRFRR